MRRITRLNVLLLGVVLVLLLAAAVVHYSTWQQSAGPSYKGHSLAVWASCDLIGGPIDGRPFDTTAQEVREARIALGTNNLRLLVRWAAFDSTKRSILAPVFDRLPLFIRQTGIFDPPVRRRIRGGRLADAAENMFKSLGPLAAPAVPALTRMATKRDGHVGRRALNCLEGVGEPGVPGLVSMATNAQLGLGRWRAVLALWQFTNSPLARFTLTNALNGPDKGIRDVARAALDRGNRGY